MFKVSGHEELEAPEKGIHHTLAVLQEKTSFLPDYGFKADEPEAEGLAETASWPAVDSGTTTSGLVGGLMTLALALSIGILFRKRRKTA